MISFFGQNIISIRDLAKQDIEYILSTTEDIKKGLNEPIGKLKELSNELKRKRVASLFFEPSTRTRISSELAISDLDLYTDGLVGTESSSAKKGEPLKDTARMFECYLNQAIFIRHPLEGSARYVAEQVNIPVINCGDGANEHPTQTLLDLFSIKECQGRLRDLTIVLIGDLKYGRTTHSLIIGLSKFPNIHVILVSPEQLRMPNTYIDYFRNKTGQEPEIVSDLKFALSRADIVYMTRIQRERFPEGPEGDYEYKKVSGIYKLDKNLIEKSKPKPNMRILHPLPRFKENLEIAFDVDNLPYAYFIQQAQNGLFTRTAISALVLGLIGKDYQLVGEKETFNLPEHQELPITKKEVKRDIFKIKDGTIIDHIERGKVLELLKITGLDSMEYTNTILPIKNLRSIRYGSKDVLVVQDKYLERELSKIALVSKTATVDYIRNWEIIKKFKVNVPFSVKGLIECSNPRCITRPEHYEHVPTLFYNEQKNPEDPLILRCAYCEKQVNRDNLKILI